MAVAHEARKKGVLIIVLIAAIIVFGGGGWYAYDQWAYVTTDNASVQGSDPKGSIVPLISPGNGILLDWHVEPGMQVSKGAVLGKVDELTGAVDLRAPITGTIVKNYAVNKQVVLPGQQLGYMVDLSDLQIVANVDETKINMVQIGKPVDIWIDAFPGVKFHGKVTQIGTASAVIINGIPNTSLTSVFDKVVQRVPVYISIEDTQGRHIIPGLSSKVAIHKH